MNSLIKSLSFLSVFRKSKVNKAYNLFFIIVILKALIIYFNSLINE